MPTTSRRIALAAAWLGGSVCVTACATAFTPASAADFDGSKPLLCAVIETHACDPGEICLRGLSGDLGLPRFMRVDFERKTIAGPKRATLIGEIDKSGNQILMQGTELGYAWTMVVDKTDGSMTLSLVNRDDAFVVFGNCTPP
ncbi:hypothetical protein AWB81_02540 [Caballeronia arationis]|jgi:hypothetical protein|uniref:Lipoprotein n=1 Tax=Caballeronia arationis TaxID=1777142 RepID=A0A7Z7I654_9BURK|nr:hypothetical protein [Caballeronia arationis]SAK65166.1 hypothetical protein AWB81_02540 [Caballeronia arationis]SOE63899.1 hypothetical protein SAMN05446927_2623 [Caballeronia arationis]